MKPLLHDSAADLFDFRSQRFCDAAQALARATACSLVQCRQELFIAEGDFAQAYMVLLAGCAQRIKGQPLH